MKNTIKFIAAMAAFTWATGTFASGNHAGGHSHGASSIGQAGDINKVSRVVTIEMTDAMRFNPSSVTVKQGETIRFVLKNTGQLQHEFNLGSEADLKAHAALMQKMPGMEHDEPNIADVPPGGTGEVIWKFTKDGKVSFACLHAGHYEAGMKGSVNISKGKMK